MEWHAKTIDEVLVYYGVTPDGGLTTQQVRDYRVKYGENVMASQKTKPAWLLFLEQFNDPIIYILIVAAILNAIFATPKDTIVIGVVVLLNATIGFVQERRATDALKALRQIAAPLAKVVRLNGQQSIREGAQQFIQTSEVVCGDIIVLESGMRVPADARLIDSHNLLVDESMLTGESFAITKRPNSICESDSALGDRFNMVYSGSIIHKGRASAVVTSVGRNTEIGKISQYIIDAEESASPLQLQIEKFGKGLSIAILSIVIFLFIIGFIQGNNWIVMLMTSVGLAVSAIPEGLPIAVTITLSIGIYQMAKHNAIVKKLSAVESLGSTNIICTDKTGTLTKNQMRVSKLFCGEKEFDFTGSGYERSGDAIDTESNSQVNFDHNSALNLATIVSGLCTETSISEDGNNWKITGDPTEGALMIAARKLGFEKNDWNVSIDIPFESENQLMAVKAKSNNRNYLLVKGAPEKIINRCRSMISSDGTEKPIQHDLINSEITKLSNLGLRVLALSYSDNPPDKKIDFEDLHDLLFIGFAGIEDSVRPEATAAVTDCHSAGIKVVMITGDHAKTAQSVAKSVGIGREIVAISERTKELEIHDPVVVIGKEIDNLSDDELFKRIPDIDVFARVAPHHKFRIVKQLQAHGNLVAMTGDGVNDAPALKQADIGVAMGSGTDVAKESAQMVLMDDNFASIVQAVRRGRVILHNLQHILIYILATSFGGLLTIAVSVLAGMPLPLLPAQLLWVNLVTDGTSTVPLAFEKEHGNVMVFPPRRKGSSLITKAIIKRIIFAGILMMLGTLGVYYIFIQDIMHLSVIDINNKPVYKLIYMKAQTVAFCILAFYQIWNVQNSRSIDRSLFFGLPYSNHGKLDRIGITQNKILLGIMLLALVLQIAAVELPFMNIVFNTIPLNFIEWLLVITVSFSIIILVEISKYISARFTSLELNKKLVV